MTIKKTNTNETSKDEKLILEIESYQHKIKSLEKQLAEAKGEKGKKVKELEPKFEFPEENDEPYSDAIFNDIQIPENFGILVMNISKTHAVNLPCHSYTANDRTNNYFLPKFGDQIIIPFGELKEFIKWHRNLIEMGFVAILNKDVNRKYNLLGLKVLDEGLIEKFLNAEFDTSTMISILHTIPIEQKNSLFQSMVKRLAENENSFDQYTVSKVSREFKVDLERMADDFQAYQEIYSGESQSETQY